jgi:hypothetical protein
VGSPDRTLVSALLGHRIKLPGGDVVAVIGYERVGVLWLHARVVEPVTMTQGVVFLLDPAVALDAKLQEAQEQQQPAGGAGAAAAVDPAPAADRPGDGTQAVSAAVAQSQPPARSRPCCRRLGSVWCTRTDAHEESGCRGPEERELPGNPLDRGRVRP